MPADTFAEKIGGPFEVGRHLLPLISFEEVRAGSDKRIYKSGTVLAGTAARRLDPTVNFVSVVACGLDDVEIIFTFVGIDIGIADVFFFGALVMGFQRPGGSALVLCKP